SLLKRRHRREFPCAREVFREHIGNVCGHLAFENGVRDGLGEDIARNGVDHGVEVSVTGENFRPLLSPRRGLGLGDFGLGGLCLVLRVIATSELCSPLGARIFVFVCVSEVRALGRRGLGGLQFGLRSFRALFRLSLLTGEFRDPLLGGNTVRLFGTVALGGLAVLLALGFSNRFRLSAFGFGRLFCGLVCTL